MTNVQINSQGKVYTANGQALLSTKNIQSLNVTPSTSSQTITAPSGTDGYSPVNVAAVTASIDSNISAENIKKDVQILGVTGSYEGSGGGASNGEFWVIAPNNSNYTHLSSFIINGTDYAPAIKEFFSEAVSVGFITYYKIKLPLGQNYTYTVSGSGGWEPVSKTGKIYFINNVSQLYSLKFEEDA
jgi:hypothetical protein